MNKRLKSIIREEQKTEKQIEALQEHLKEVRIRRKQIEDEAILRSIRGMKLDKDALLELLDGIQSGSIVIQPDYEDDEADKDDDALAAEDEIDIAKALDEAYSRNLDSEESDPEGRN